MRTENVEATPEADLHHCIAISAFCSTVKDDETDIANYENLCRSKMKKLTEISRVFNAAKISGRGMLINTALLTIIGLFTDLKDERRKLL